MWVNTGVRWPETPGQELPGREAGQGMPGTGGMGQTLRFGGGMTYLGNSTQTSWGKGQEVRTTKRLWSSREVSSSLQRAQQRRVTKGVWSRGMRSRD